MKSTLILFLTVFTLIEADKPKVDIGTIRLPKEWEAAWIDFIEPIIKFKNGLLGAKYLMIGLLKGGFLLYRPIAEQSSIKHVKKKGISEEQIVTRSWIDVIIIDMKILFKIECKFGFHFSRIYFN